MALQRVAGNGAQHNGPQRVVDVRPELVWQCERFMQHTVDRTVGVALRHQGLAGQHLGQHQAGGKDVHGRGGGLALRDFGRHVTWCAGVGWPIGVRVLVLNRRRNSEVHHAGPARFIDQHVGGLHVAVDHTRGMGGHESIEHVHHQVGGLDRRHGSPGSKHVGQGLARNVLEHQVGVQVLHVGLEHRNDVGVGQSADMARLLQPLGNGGDVRAFTDLHELDGDLAFQSRVEGQPDDRLRALAQDPTQLETTQQGLSCRIGLSGGQSPDR